MAYTVDILNAKKVAEYGLLSKIQVGGKIYEIKDLIARENINSLSAGLDAIAGDLAALSYVKATGQFADDAAIKSYVDSQVGAINKFDVHVMLDGEALPTASAETMYVLYLKPEADAASGAYVEYITVKNGDEYKWEAIGSTKMDVTGFVTSEALASTIKPINDRLAELGDLANKDEADLDLKALAHKDSASGTVAGQTISGVKATGTAAGSINVELQQSEHAMNSTGKFTPAGNVSGTVVTDGSIAVTAKYAADDAVLTKGDYTPAGTVSADFSHSATAATLTKADYTPAGSVSVVLSGNTFNAMTGVGTQASFTEGTFTAATLDYAAAEYSVAKEGIVGSVEDEMLTFTAAGLEAISASKINSFNGGSKESDVFVPNSLPTMAEQNVGVQSASFAGTKAAEALVTGVSYDKAALENLAFSGTTASQVLVTGVSYQKADIDSATFTGKTVDIAASFAGTEADVSVAGICHDYAVKTAEFTGGALELNVGDIVVSEKSVTVQ
jgi:uncharacterized protein YjbI with pentapeptide repeats